MIEHWHQIYLDSYKSIPNKIPSIKGVVVGFNVNIDMIIPIRPQTILRLISQYNLSRDDLLEKIEQWPGVIKTPIDFIIGLCGCFKNGIASEWLIKNREVYEDILHLLNKKAELYLGGQAGIMANLLIDFGVRKVIVHVASMTENLKKLFSPNPNLVVPFIEKDGRLLFLNPKEIPDLDDIDYYHIISEFRKGDIVKLDSKTKWPCPRNNRFIATYDPPNFTLKINDAFTKQIAEIAKQSNAFILSGFHMLLVEGENIELLDMRIKSVITLIEQAKKINPNLIIHLEVCSTKNRIIFNHIFNVMENNFVWDSIGLNEQELIDILISLGKSSLATSLKENMTQENILNSCLLICNMLHLKRLHLHQIGCYILIVRNNYHMVDEDLRKCLCFTAICTAHKAMTNSSFKELEKSRNLFLDKEKIILTKEFKELAKYLDGKGMINNDTFLNSGLASTTNYRVIAIPTIIINKPHHTVGLGDTVSATALISELALRDEKY